MSSLSIRLERPAVLINTPEAIFLELPRGKVNKKGEIVIQQAQKEEFCFFYAMKRLLSTEQIRSQHGQICSGLRNRLALAKTTPSLVCNAHSCFFNELNLNIENEWKKNCKDIMKKKDLGYLWNDSRVDAMFDESYEHQIYSRTAHNLWYLKMQHIQNATFEEMAKGHGLKKITYGMIQTIRDLIKVIKINGPLLIGGCFGSAYYGNLLPKKFKRQMGTHPLYGWEKNPERSVNTTIERPADMTLEDAHDIILEKSHAIVVVGAEVLGQNELVYWIDPNNPNDPNQIDSQHIHVSKFETIRSNLRSIEGLDMKELPKPTLLNCIDQAKVYGWPDEDKEYENIMSFAEELPAVDVKELFTVGYYNPNFAPLKA